MCERQATSREHVPPKCFFPEHKDLPAGFDFRRNLITVPSCEQHNSEKSADDEFLLFIIALQHRGNSCKDKHFESKVMRTFNRSPDRFAKMMKEIVPIQCTGLDGEQFESAMFKADLDRFDRAVHHLACGVYYHHYRRKWMGKSSSLSNMFGTSGNISSPENRFIAWQIEIISKSFEELSVHGENQKIFSYQIYSRSGLEHAMRLRFF
jgi:hypothetical protein